MLLLIKGLYLFFEYQWQFLLFLLIFYNIHIYIYIYISIKTYICYPFLSMFLTLSRRVGLYDDIVFSTGVVSQVSCGRFSSSARRAMLSWRNSSHPGWGGNWLFTARDDARRVRLPQCVRYHARYPPFQPLLHLSSASHPLGRRHLRHPAHRTIA